MEAVAVVSLVPPVVATSDESCSSFPTDVGVDVGVDVDVDKTSHRVLVRVLLVLGLLLSSVGSSLLNDDTSDMAAVVDDTVVGAVVALGVLLPRPIRQTTPSVFRERQCVL